MKTLWNHNDLTDTSKRLFSGASVKGMFRKHLCVLLACMMVLSLVAAGCQNTSDEPPTEDPAPTDETLNQEPANDLPLIQDEALLAKIEDTCRPYFEYKGFTGLSIGVIKDGEIAYFNYGTTEKDGTVAVTEDTIYEIASNTKPFTAALLGLLANRETVSLSQPISDFFDHAVPTFNGEEATLRDLATHSSGLPRLPDNLVINDNPYKDYTEAMLLDYLQQGQLNWKPGTAYSYSNLGMGLLGYILGKAADSSYGELLQENILAPIGMDSTALVLNAEQQARKAKPHIIKGLPGHEWDFDVLEGCGGLKSTTRDMTRYLMAYLGHLEINDELEAALKKTQHLYYNGSDAQMGLGWFWGQVGGVNMWNHTGQVGGYCSFTGFSPYQDIGIVLLCNNATTVDNLADQLVEVLAGDQ